MKKALFVFSALLFSSSFSFASYLDITDESIWENGVGVVKHVVFPEGAVLDYMSLCLTRAEFYAKEAKSAGIELDRVECVIEDNGSEDLGGYSVIMFRKKNSQRNIR